MVLELKRRKTVLAGSLDRSLVRVLARWILAAASHEADRQELVELSHCAQQSYPRIEMRTGSKVDELLRAFHPVRDRHKAWNAEIAGDVEHPEPASSISKPGFELVNVGIVELAKIQLPALQAIVPPDCVCIPLHQLEEALDDGLLERVAGGAAVGVRMHLVAAGAFVEEIEKSGRKKLESFIAQGPDRRPFDLRRGIERGGDRHGGPGGP